VNIILHIFKKDIRYYWPEALISVVLTGVFVWYQPYQWATCTSQFRFFANVLEILPLFMILAWLFLIVRIVQAESLIGDRQFWITRPFEWPKLLCAKLLFTAAFILLPVFAGQIILLKLALFPATPYLLDLVWLELMLFLALVIPSLAIASLNPGIGRTALTLIVLILFIIGMSGLLTLFPDSSFRLIRMTEFNK